MRVAPAPTKTCIYCLSEKPQTEFTLEHVFPGALGGKLCSDLFKTRDVCGRCNNIAGLFVDGAFVKGYLHAAGVALPMQEYLDPRRPDSISPLIYMGRLNGLALPHNEICEMWIGPCGVQYYHIHEQDDPRWDGFAGGDPIARKADPGRVYIGLTTVQPDWVGLAFRSAADFFEESQRYAPNVAFQADPAAKPLLHPMDPSASEEAARILAMPNQKNMGVVIDPGFDQRFSAKAALALGYKIFGTAFLATAQAGRLRGLMREKDPARRAAFKVRGSDLLSTGDDRSAEFRGWKGAYTIHIGVFGDYLLLSIYLPTTQGMHIVIADEPAMWQSHNYASYREGVVYLVLPQVGHFAGPISHPEFIAHKIGTHRNPLLAAIEGMRVDQSTLPECR
jgi:hypothetical protein